MQPINLEADLDDGVTIDADVCIVGSGAAGSTVALGLVKSGLKIVILEGGMSTPSERHQSLYDIDSVGFPIRENFQNRVRQLGGSCNIWAGRTMIMSRFDFEKRSWVRYSGWPIGYDEMQSYFFESSNK